MNNRKRPITDEESSSSSSELIPASQLRKPNYETEIYWIKKIRETISLKELTEQLQQKKSTVNAAIIEQTGKSYGINKIDILAHDKHLPTLINALYKNHKCSSAVIQELGSLFSLDYHIAKLHLELNYPQWKTWETIAPTSFTPEEIDENPFFAPITGGKPKNDLSFPDENIESIYNNDDKVSFFAARTDNENPTPPSNPSVAALKPLTAIK